LSKKPCTLRGAGLFFAFFLTTVVILKSLSLICHSGLDPESSGFALDFLLGFTPLEIGTAISRDYGLLP
jgi:hypothetical protein